MIPLVLRSLGIILWWINCRINVWNFCQLGFLINSPVTTALKKTRWIYLESVSWSYMQRQFTAFISFLAELFYLHYFQNAGYRTNSGKINNINNIISPRDCPNIIFLSQLKRYSQLWRQQKKFCPDLSTPIVQTQGSESFEHPKALLSPQLFQFLPDFFIHAPKLYCIGIKANFTIKLNGWPKFYSLRLATFR